MWEGDGPGRREMVFRVGRPGPFPLNRFLCILTTAGRGGLKAMVFALCNAPEWIACRFVTHGDRGVFRASRGMLGAKPGAVWGSSRARGSRGWLAWEAHTPAH